MKILLLLSIISFKLFGHDYELLNNVARDHTHIKDIEDFNEYSYDERCFLATRVYENAIERFNELIEKRGARYVHISHILGPQKDADRLCKLADRHAKCIGGECLSVRDTDGLTEYEIILKQLNQ